LFSRGDEVRTSVEVAKSRVMFRDDLRSLAITRDAMRSLAL